MCLTANILSIPSIRSRCYCCSLYRARYVSEERDGPLIRKLFPRAEIRSLDTGHLVHSEKPKEFVDEVLRFINTEHE